MLGNIFSFWGIHCGHLVGGGGVTLQSTTRIYSQERWRDSLISLLEYILWKKQFPILLFIQQIFVKLIIFSLTMLFLVMGWASLHYCFVGLGDPAEAHLNSEPGLIETGVLTRKESVDPKSTQSSIVVVTVITGNTDDRQDLLSTGLFGGFISFM